METNLQVGVSTSCNVELFPWTGSNLAPAQAVKPSLSTVKSTSTSTRISDGRKHQVLHENQFMSREGYGKLLLNVNVRVEKRLIRIIFG